MSGYGISKYIIKSEGYIILWYMTAFGLQIVFDHCHRSYLPYMPKRWTTSKYAKNEYYYNNESQRLTLIYSVLDIMHQTNIIFLPGERIKKDNTNDAVIYVVIDMLGHNNEYRIIVPEDSFTSLNTITHDVVELIHIQSCYTVKDSIFDKDISYKNVRTDNTLYGIESSDEIYSVYFKYKGKIYNLEQNSKVANSNNIKYQIEQNNTLVTIITTTVELRCLNEIECGGGDRYRKWVYFVKEGNKILRKTIVMNQILVNNNNDNVRPWMNKIDEFRNNLRVDQRVLDNGVVI